MRSRLLRFLLSGIVTLLGLAPSAMTQPPPAAAAKPEPFSLSISGDLDTESAAIAGKLTTVFFQSYPKLVERFSNPKKPAPRQVKVVLKPRLDVPAYCQGDTISVSLEWLRKHPDDVGLLTHELMHVVQAYPTGRPGWFTEGIADYARLKYGPEKQPGWSLPERLTARQKYTDSYRVTARFLVWLDDKHPGVVDKLHRRMQDREFELDDFKTYTKKTVQDLWDECMQELAKKR